MVRTTFIIILACMQAHTKTLHPLTKFGASFEKFPKAGAKVKYVHLKHPRAPR